MSAQKVTAPIVVGTDSEMIRVSRPAGMTDERWSEVKDAYQARWREVLADVRGKASR